LLHEPNILHEASRGLLDAKESYSRGDISGLATVGSSLLKLLIEKPEMREKIRRSNTSPADVIQLSGSKDYQTSADTVVGVT
jgi:metacaspase-1